MIMKKNIVAPVVLLVVLTAIILYFDVFRKLAGNPGKIEGSGTIEVTEVNISSKISGRVADLPRAEGDSCAAGI